MPPRYSPAAETASKVVAVPKSTMMHGPPYFSKAATAARILAGADAAPVARVEVEDAVGLAEANRPEHDGLGLVGAAGHARSSLGTGTDRAASAL